MSGYGRLAPPVEMEYTVLLWGKSLSAACTRPIRALAGRTKYLRLVLLWGCREGPGADTLSGRADRLLEVPLLFKLCVFYVFSSIKFRLC